MTQNPKTINNVGELASTSFDIVDYLDEAAYDMANLYSARTLMNALIDHPDSSKPGEGVTIAILDTGLNFHLDLMTYPNQTERKITYLDLDYFTETQYKIHERIIEDPYTDSDLNGIPDDWDNTPLYREGTTEIYGYIGPSDAIGHGTAICGIITHIVPYADIIIVDVGDSEGSPTGLSFVDGLYELNKRFDPDIISISFSHFSLEGWSEFEVEMEEILSDGTTTMVVAAGNGNGDVANYYPAAFSETLSVGSVYTRGRAEDLEGVSSLTHNGEELDVSAPGDAVGTLYSEDIELYINAVGTSMAAPIVSGEAALIYQAFSMIYGIKPNDMTVKEIIKMNCDPGGSDTDPDDYDQTPGHNDEYGHGIIDMMEAINSIINDDEDGDSLVDIMENIHNSNPDNDDTDGDGLLDGYEVYIVGTDPNNDDTDGDGLLDGYEVNTLGSDPTISNIPIILSSSYISQDDHDPNNIEVGYVLRLEIDLQGYYTVKVEYRVDGGSWILKSNSIHNLNEGLNILYDDLYDTGQDGDFVEVRFTVSFFDETSCQTTATESITLVIS